MMRHEITVARLRELLTALQDDDLLLPNAVGNLMILRRESYVGFINLLEGRQTVELYTEDREVPDARPDH